MTTERDYGSGGRLALATPQGNPTVEPEMRRLFPMDVEYYTLRLTSRADEPRQRMIDYLEGLPVMAERFAGMPLDGLLFACTASSYLVPPEEQWRLIETTEAYIGARVFMAAHAIRTWLEDRGFTRIALLTPYPDWLNDPAEAWWRASGFHVAGKEQVQIGSNNTYAIYEQQTADARPHFDRWLRIDADAWVVSGTGMPSLPMIRELSNDGRPIVSSNLALATAGLRSLNRNAVLPEPPREASDD
jgi:maleate isomerase